MGWTFPDKFSEIMDLQSSIQDVQARASTSCIVGLKSPKKAVKLCLQIWVRQTFSPGTGPFRGWLQGEYKERRPCEGSLQDKSIQGEGLLSGELRRFGPAQEVLGLQRDV